MANSLNDVIRRLEQQRAGIERALLALREIESPAADGVRPAAAAAAPSSAAGSRKAKRKGGMTAEGRRRLSEALRARWAAKKAGTPAAAAAAPAAGSAKAKRKGGMTDEVRKRLSEALRKRWAAKRAAAGTATKKGRK
jgi:hypothetical protein